MPAAHTTRPYDPATESGILVVLPHPDDESFATGGTLARAAAAGVPSTYLCGTFGDMGRRMGRPAFTNREALRDVRVQELEDACEILGCRVRYMGLRDKCVEFEDPDLLAQLIRAVIGEVGPSVVFTYYPGFGVHPDHDALGHATVLALRGIPAANRPRLLAVAVGERDSIREELGEPDYACDIEAFAEVKLNALRAHRSQTETMFAQLEHDSEDIEKSPADEQREEFMKRERFFELDPDSPTPYEKPSA